MIYSYAPFGYQGIIVEVEAEVRKGIPGIDIVGMAGTAVREAAARIRAACRKCRLPFPRGRILVNLAPADFPKKGSGFDLAIAVSILKPDFKDFLIIGELSLDGNIKPVSGIEAALWCAKEKGIKNALIPAGIIVNKVPGLKIYSISNLNQLHSVSELSFIVKSGKVETQGESGDFSDLLGHSELKDILGAAAIGRHHVLLSGPPGCGKSMAASRFAGILPDLCENKKVEVRRIHSLSNENHSGAAPPVRMPHHSSSLEGLIGGGKALSPGEISLAHNGLLILDEMGEFKANVIQALRQPMEMRLIHITRIGYKSFLPADFQLFATMNACTCGMLGKNNSRCLCSIHDLKRYWKRIGSPLLDRIDIRVPLTSTNSTVSQSTAQLKNKVQIGVDRQAFRAKGQEWTFNRDIPVRKLIQFYKHEPALESLLEKLSSQLKFSTRAKAGALRTALSIADFKDRDPDLKDIARAVQYRRIGEGGMFWPDD